MPTTITYSEIEKLAMSLSQAERLHLAERLLGLGADEGDAETRMSWMDLDGCAPNMLNGLDAQEWVRRIRSGEDLTLPSTDEAMK